MDTARQVIRWALPGWVAYLFWAGYIVLHAFSDLLVDEILYGQSQSQYFRILGRLTELITPLGIAAIPLGFVIYQLYYWTYWYLPIPSIFGLRLIDPKDRGRQILSGVEGHIDFWQLFAHGLHDAPATAYVKVLGFLEYKAPWIMTQYRENWHLSESAWYLALSNERYKTTADSLDRRTQLLGDIYHSTGACYIALGLAYIVYLFAITVVSIMQFTGRRAAPISPIVNLPAILISRIELVVMLLLFGLVTSIAIIGVIMFQGARKASFDALLTLRHDVITNALNSPTKLSDTTEPAVLGELSQSTTNESAQSVTPLPVQPGAVVNDADVRVVTHPRENSEQV